MEAWISIVDFKVLVGIYPTGVDFLPFNLRISYRTLSSLTSLKEKLSGILKASWISKIVW